MCFEFGEHFIHLSLSNCEKVNVVKFPVERCLYGEGLGNFMALSTDSGAFAKYARAPRLRPILSDTGFSMVSPSNSVQSAWSVSGYSPRFWSAAMN